MVWLVSGGVTSLTGTEALTEHAGQLELAIRREPRPRPGWGCPWLSTEAPTAHCSTCSRCALRIPMERTTQNL